MIRLATTLAAVALLAAAPAASAQGFREPEVRAALEANGLGALADTIAPAARPAMIVDRSLLEREPGELGTTRLGGRPDLPAGTKWPRCHGYAQTFLAQLRLRDLPAEAAELNGQDGTVLFFAHIDRVDGSWNQPFSGECTTVVHARTGTTLRRARFPRHALRLRPAVPRFDVRPDLPDMNFPTSSRLMPPLHAVKLEDSFAWSGVRDRLEGHGRPPAPRARLQRVSDRRLPVLAARRAHDRPLAPPLHARLRQAARLRDRAASGASQFLISPSDLQAGRFERACGFFDRY